MNRLILEIAIFRMTRGFSLLQRLRHAWYLSAFLGIAQNSIEVTVLQKDSDHAV